MLSSGNRFGYRGQKTTGNVFPPGKQICPDERPAGRMPCGKGFMAVTMVLRYSALRTGETAGWTLFPDRQEGTAELRISDAAEFDQRKDGGF